MEMQELVRAIEDLNQKVAGMRTLLHIAEKEETIAALSAEVSDPDFWGAQEHATRVSKQLGELQQEYDRWKKLKEGVDILFEVARLDEKDTQVSLREELEAQYAALKSEADDLEFFTLLGGAYDKNNAIVAIHAGAGGTEAQDWAGMLLRMYLRFAQLKGWRAIILDEHRGQEAGYKSVMFRVDGRYAYGFLKSEHGVHRLVRISPYDAEKMRHTSFALVEVLPELDESVTIAIDPRDLRVDTFMSGGHGGQSVNTTYSAVRVVHIPTGITVSCQNERSQLQNKETALNILRAKLLALEMQKRAAEKQELRGEYQSAEWGNQIRSYVIHPYKMVKDLRTRYETQDVVGVLDGALDALIGSYLKMRRME